MTRDELLKQIEETYQKIYGFTEDMGDDALELLDMYVFEAGLSELDSILMEALIDEYDPKNLLTSELETFLITYKSALDTLQEG